MTVESIHSEPCLIFGCGNSLFGDDGFGAAVPIANQKRHRFAAQRGHGSAVPVQNHKNTKNTGHAPQKSLHKGAIMIQFHVGRRNVNTDWNKDLKVKFMLQDPWPLICLSLGILDENERAYRGPDLAEVGL